MELESSLPFAQEPTIGPYPESDGEFQCYPDINPSVSYMFSYFNCFLLKFYLNFYSCYSHYFLLSLYFP
jgi:hypothetical protein